MSDVKCPHCNHCANGCDPCKCCGKCVRCGNQADLPASLKPAVNPFPQVIPYPVPYPVPEPWPQPVPYVVPYWGQTSNRLFLVEEKVKTSCGNWELAEGSTVTFDATSALQTSVCAVS